MRTVAVTIPRERGNAFMTAYRACGNTRRYVAPINAGLWALGMEQFEPNEVELTVETDEGTFLFAVRSTPVVRMAKRVTPPA